MQQKRLKSPEPLKTKKFNISETPIARAKTAKHKTRIVASDGQKINGQERIFSESFNNFLENHALTSLSPVEIIDHYKFETLQETKKNSTHVQVQRKYSPIQLSYDSAEIDFLIDDAVKIENLLFAKEKKKKRLIISTTKAVDNDFRIVGSSLNSNRRISNINKITRNIPKKICKYNNLKNLAIKSPTIQYTSTDLLIN